jgi:hypothetical protein
VGVKTNQHESTVINDFCCARMPFPPRHPRLHVPGSKKSFTNPPEVWETAKSVTFQGGDFTNMNGTGGRSIYGFRLRSLFGLTTSDVGVTKATNLRMRTLSQILG